jgi:hypothetical protein
MDTLELLLGMAETLLLELSSTLWVAAEEQLVVAEIRPTETVQLLQLQAWDYSIPLLVTVALVEQVTQALQVVKHLTDRHTRARALLSF